jgi:NitT/TauT family transport system substrate-binding protein
MDMKSTCIAALFASGLVAATFVSAAQATDNVKLLLDWTPGGFSAAWYYGIKNGCFPDQGINLTVERGYGGGDTVTKIAAGAGDFGVADLSSIMLGRLGADAKVKAIMPMYSASPISIATLEGSGITKIADLEGKTVAAAPGDSGIKILPVALKKMGADFSKVHVETVDFSTLTGLLLQGKVDAITTYSTSVMIIQQAAEKVGKKIHVIRFAADLGVYSNSILASDKLIGSNPDLVKRFKAASQCAFEKTRNHIPEAVATMNAAIGGMDEALHSAIAKASIELIFDNPNYKAAPFGWNPEGVAKTLEVAEKAQGLDTKIDPMSFVVE